MAENWVLDGVALVDNVNFRILNQIDLAPAKGRPEWISGAESDYAGLTRTPLHENRTQVFDLETTPQASRDAVFDLIGQIRDKCRLASKSENGIALVWTSGDSTRTVTWDVLDGEITGLPFDLAWDLANAAKVTLTLTCKPYWRKGSETLSSTVTTSTPMQVIEVTVPGDAPANARLIVSDQALKERRFLEWGVESNYDASTSLILDSDNLVTSGFTGTGATRSGAYDPNATGNNVVRAITAKRTSAICGTGDLTHVGSYRVKARVYSDAFSGANNYSFFRLAWQAGGSSFSYNNWVQPSASGWNTIDLGTITIPTVASGTQRWSGRLEAYYNTAGSAQVDVDYLTLIPIEDGYGKARATYSYVPGVTSLLDNFTDLVGVALNGRTTFNIGSGTWATSGATGDFGGSTLAGDYTPLGSYVFVRNTNVVETGPRFAVAGSSMTDIEVGGRMGIWGAGAGLSWAGKKSGVIARWVNATNYAFLELVHSGILTLGYVSGGARVELQSVTVPPAVGLQGLRIVAYSTGQVFGTLTDANGSAIATLKGSSTVLRTGGGLASGTGGLLDQSTDTNVVRRVYDDWYVAVPPSEPLVMYSSGSAQITGDGSIRPDAGGFYGRPPSYRGTRFELQPGTNRVAVALRRNDVETTNDDNVTDSTRIQVAYEPRGLVVPRS